MPQEIVDAHEEDDPEVVEVQDDGEEEVQDEGNPDATPRAARRHEEGKVKPG